MSFDNTLDLAFGGQPFVVLAPAGENLDGLDFALAGAPFFAPPTTYITHINESTVASDFVSVFIEYAEDAAADAAAGLDLAFQGQPFFQTGTNTFTLDWAHGGQPFVASTVPFTGKIQPSIKIFSDPQML